MRLIPTLIFVGLTKCIKSQPLRRILIAGSTQRHVRKNLYTIVFVTPAKKVLLVNEPLNEFSDTLK